MIKKYRRKPVEVEVLQFTGDNEQEFKKFGLVLYQPFSNNADLRLIYPFGISGLALEIRKGDYLVKDIKDYWVYKVYSEKFFKNKYEEIPPNLNERFENYEGETKQGEYFND